MVYTNKTSAVHHHPSRLLLTLSPLLLLLLACGQEAPAVSGSNPAVSPARPPQQVAVARIDSTGATIQARISTPPHFIRTEATPQSFAEYLRTLPLKPAGAKVLYYNGASKANQGVYAAVIDLPIGRRDLHQCADAVMRLRAEYLWEQAQYDKIHFNFTNGFRVDYAEWMRGKRIRVDGHTVRWVNSQTPSNTHADLWHYLEIIFAYAGTASLEKELLTIAADEVTIGDVLIQGGYPGHAVIIVDQAVNPATGQHVYLLAQSYMPAQELQLLQNPQDATLSPWYELDTGAIQTPEWTFSSEDLKRFAE